MLTIVVAIDEIADIFITNNGIEARFVRFFQCYQRAADTYRAKGFDEEWINKRLRSIISRKKLTDVWRENGVDGPTEFAIPTNEIYKEWSGMTAKEYKNFKGLRKENLRDNMSDLEVLLADIGETATREIAKAKRSQGLKENKKVAKTGGK